MEDYAKETTFARVKKAIEGYAYIGRDSTELFNKKITTTQLLKPETMKSISKKALNIIEIEKDNYDKISKVFKDNILTIVGEEYIKDFKEGLGGGFQYCELSEPLFDELGLLNEAITHKMLAKHLYFTEFGQALSNDIAENTYLGKVHDISLYVFTNKDFKKADFNRIIKEKHNECIVYADRTTMSEDELKKHNITFKQLPFSVKDK